MHTQNPRGTSRACCSMKVSSLRHDRPCSLGHLFSQGRVTIVWLGFLFPKPRWWAPLHQAACYPPVNNVLRYGVSTHWNKPPLVLWWGVPESLTCVVIRTVPSSISGSGCFLQVSRTRLWHLHWVHLSPATGSPHNLRSRPSSHSAGNEVKCLGTEWGHSFDQLSTQDPLLFVFYREIDMEELVQIKKSYFIYLFRDKEKERSQSERNKISSGFPMTRAWLGAQFQDPEITTWLTTMKLNHVSQPGDPSLSNCLKRGLCLLLLCFVRPSIEVKIPFCIWRLNPSQYIVEHTVSHFIGYLFAPIIFVLHTLCMR